MWDAIIALINKLPKEYLMIIIPALIGFFFFYVIPHLRRDKQGKLYWHSDRYEQIKQTRKLDFIVDKMRCVEVDVCKGNIFTTEMPLGERMASAIKYLNSGGNGETKKYINLKLKPKNKQMYEELEKLMNENKPKV